MWRRREGLAIPGAALGLTLLATAGLASDPTPGSDGEVAASVREVLALSGDARSGARAFESCAVCHQADGRGRADGTFPQLAGQHREVIVKQLVDIREGRRRNPVMAPFAETLIDAQELADVAAYIETLPPPPPGTGTALEDGGERAEGRHLYARDCQGCHGARGEGDGTRFVPMLARQHELYLLRQIRAIAAGRRGNAHPAMQRLVSGYGDAELRAVVHYAARLPGAGTAPERAPGP